MTLPAAVLIFTSVLAMKRSPRSAISASTSTASGKCRSRLMMTEAVYLKRCGLRQTREHKRRSGEGCAASTDVLC